MKLYIVADMEGASGICTHEQVRSASPDYGESRRKMAADVNAAIDEAFRAGAQEVVVCDTHAGGGRLRIEEMDSRGIYETPHLFKLMPSLDASFDGIMLIGAHSRAGTLNGFLDHTVSSASWFEYRLNDQIIGEVGIAAAYAGHFGVPVVVVSGDMAVKKEAETLLGDVECAVVKWGICRNKARCLPPAKAHELIREAVKKALQRVGEFTPFTPTLPATIQLTLFRSDMADEYSSRPGVERVNARTIKRRIASFLEVCRW